MTQPSDVQPDTDTTPAVADVPVAVDPATVDQADPAPAATAVTAKVYCSSKTLGASKGATPNGASVTFAVDYADDRNKEWAQYTPSLSLTMQVKNPDLFELGQAYTLTFTPDES
jgi:hypothetical protein